MSRAAKMALIAVATLFILACNLFMPKAPDAPSPASTVLAANTQAPPQVTVVPSSTALPVAAPVDAAATPLSAVSPRSDGGAQAAPTLRPVPSDTALPAATATAIAKPVPSDTAAPAAAPTTDVAASMVATALAASGFKGGVPTMDPTTLGPMANVGDITQYYNPVGSPLQIWNGVPIMPQATAGQEFKPDVYSYKATATLNQATQYYTTKAASIGLPPYHATGYGGTGTLASHNATFLTQQLILDIISLDNDPQHVIVIINKEP